MPITKWKTSIWKGYLLHVSKYITLWKRWNCGNSKKISGCQGWEEGEWWLDRGFVAQWEYFVWYYGRCTLSHICPAPYSAPHQEWSLRETGLWAMVTVRVGSSVVTEVPLWWGMGGSGGRGGVRSCRESLYRKSQDITFSFVLRLQLLQENKVLI